MQNRKKSLLTAIIKEYIATSRPVSSKVIADRHFSSLSSATVRNDMGELEKEGFLTHPHTSAGRTPTFEGWRFWLSQMVPKEPSKKEKEQIDKIISCKVDREQLFKELAKLMAELSREAVIVGFSKRDVYYTGLSFLFSQPEFNEVIEVRQLSQIVDHLDEVVNTIFDDINDEIQVLIGRENPFGRHCGVIITKFQMRRMPAGMVGLIGPVRMPYDINIGLIRYSQQLISNL